MWWKKGAGRKYGGNKRMKRDRMKGIFLLLRKGIPNFSWAGQRLSSLLLLNNAIEHYQANACPNDQFMIPSIC
jgi:hypothetical protein